MTWHSLSECVWASGTKIEGRISIASEYDDLRQFFVETLRVQPVDLQMIYDSLLEVSSKQTPVSRVKDLLQDFSSFVAKENNPPKPSELLRRRVFPVRKPNGNVILYSSQEEFVIVDREGPFGSFKNKVKCLDFSLQDVCRLQPFIAWAGLEARYLSRCVEEFSRIESGIEMPISETRRDLKTKAHALLR